MSKRAPSLNRSPMLFFMFLACTPMQTLEHDGMSRRYLLHVPDDLPEDAPLVFFLHGYTGHARGYSWLGMKQQADERRFGVVFPQGSRDDVGLHHWNAQLTLSDRDDVGFLTELAQTLQDDHGFDPAQTYTAGISNGGFMSYTLACQRPDVFRAAGSIIGTMSGETWETCPEHPFPVFQISGVQDTTVPFDGSMDTEGGWGGAPDMDTVMDRWVSVNGCREAQTLDVGDDDTRAERHTDCEGDAEVWYYTVSDLGHALPRWDWTGALADFFLTR